MKHILLFNVFIFFIQSMLAQFAPQAGLLGSTAIYKDSNVIINWASACTVHKGYRDIADTSLGIVTLGDSTSALGKSDGNTISLGDAGEAVYFFENPIVNGTGYDFAVFENGFRDALDSNNTYAELAQVEVSNDGINYFGFHAVSNIDTAVQIAGVGEFMDVRKLNNLAGKYIAGYGTPFDLDELSAILSLDINDIRFIKITDVIGTINPENCTRDFNQHCINDPYPTPFPSGGFDLDALCILHQKYPTGFYEEFASAETSFCYPNPCNNILFINNFEQVTSLNIYSIEGQMILSYSKLNSSTINISSLVKGNYVVKAILKNRMQTYQWISKNE